ncbi:hypothetical protein BKA64DRAFT_580217 [Cadophora sp. MPI-SDFR-AT-0126]|nr:hypothetical protein BKA64DRAFT_580217 [Leotiomycetes sp. MPI-SDFR-AT-0126]
MVYCGKPSKGCAGCRKRRIRCDQATPSCGQCTKANKECPSYRNLIDLSFRNESSSVIKKAHAERRQRSIPLSGRKANRASSTSPKVYQWDVTAVASPSPTPKRFTFVEHFSDLSHEAQAQRSPKEALSIFSMDPSMEDWGMSYFASMFMKAPGGPVEGSFVIGSLDEILVTGMTATGLAAFANKTKSSELMRHARSKYALALQTINKALGSQVDAVKDSTLQAVLLIAIWKITAGSQQQLLEEWRHHMHGTAALLKLRGRAQLGSPTSFKLFMHASTQVIVSCYHRNLPVPQEILELRQEAFTMIGNDPFCRYLQAIDDFINFRSLIRSGYLSDPETIITSALLIDRELSQIFSSVPADWIYETTIISIDQDIVFERSYDIYYDYCVAQIWNIMRTARIILNETICLQLTHLDASWPGFESQFQASADICSRMCGAILRSVPQHLGFVSRVPFQDTSLPSSKTLLSGTPLTMNKSHRVIISSWFLLWPLYTAAAASSASREIQNYAASILDYIGDVTGVQQSAVLASLIRRRAEESLGCPDPSMPGGQGNLEYAGPLRLEDESQSETEFSLKCMLEAGMELHVSLVP